MGAGYAADDTIAPAAPPAIFELSTTCTACTPYPASTTTRSVVCGMGRSENGSSPGRLGSFVKNCAPAAFTRRPSGRIVVVASSGSTPAYFRASPVGATAVHFVGAGAGYVPSHAGHVAAWGSALQSASAGHT